MDISKLRKLISLRGFNKREMATKIGFSQTAFSQALTRGDFRVSLLEKIAEILNVPVGYFFDDSKTSINK